MLQYRGYDAGLVMRARVRGRANVILRQQRAPRLPVPLLLSALVLVLPLLEQVFCAQAPGLNLARQKAPNAHLKGDRSIC